MTYDLMRDSNPMNHMINDQYHLNTSVDILSAGIGEFFIQFTNAKLGIAVDIALSTFGEHLSHHW